MKRPFLLLGIIFLLSGCKKDDSPVSAIENIVGKWRLVAYETLQNGERVWVQMDPASQSNSMNIRRDGLIVDDLGFLPCCSPESLNINGTSFKIIRNPDVGSAPMCMYVNCYACPVLNIEHSGNEMTTTSCNDFQMKYIKVVDNN